MNILKVISMLMVYPTAELQAVADDLRDEINQSKEIPPSSRVALNLLVDDVCRSEDLMDVQEAYGFLFDRGTSLSLLLFEHVHGESRDRGQAMVDLMALYQESGFEISAKELPDYIPLYLEYLAQREDMEAREGLADVAHIFGLLATRLKARQSHYAGLFDALLIISGVQVDLEELQQKVATEKRDDTVEAMDEVWEEEQVTFMANQEPTSCSSNIQSPMKPKEEVASPVHWIPNAEPSNSSPAKP